MQLLLHPRTQSAFDAAHRHPVGSYLFHGPPAVGKATAALELTRRLICDLNHEDPSLACPSCRQFSAGTYPDLELLKPEAKPSITIEQVRNLLEHLSRRPYYHHKIRVAIVDDANRLTLEASNALLKIIEEPPEQTMFILVAEQPQALLETIRSRCTAVYFSNPSPIAVSAYIVERFGLTPAVAAELVAATDSPGLAIATAADPAAIGAHAELAQDVASSLESSVFQRLLLAARLSTSTDPSKFARLLHARLIRDVIAGSSGELAAGRLQVLEQFRRRLSAGLTPRVAVELLMLEL
jgi:DNA polymerase-3 subunit delta'